MTGDEQRRRRSSGGIPRIPDVRLNFEEAGVTISVDGRVLWVTHEEARALFAELAEMYGDG